MKKKVLGIMVAMLAIFILPMSVQACEGVECIGHDYILFEVEVPEDQLPEIDGLMLLNAGWPNTRMGCCNFQNITLSRFEMHQISIWQGIRTCVSIEVRDQLRCMSCGHHGNVTFSWRPGCHAFGPHAWCPAIG